MAKMLGGIAFHRLNAVNDASVMKEWAQMLSLHSWGVDYPIHPLEEIPKAEFIIAAIGPDGMSSKELYGAACINRSANNDAKGAFDMWFSAWVVAPQERRHGIGRELHRQCLAYALNQQGPIRASSETRYMHRFFLDNGWFVTESNRTARNEAKKPTTFYAYRRGSF